MGLMSCTRIRHSIGTENLVPEEVNYTKIAIRVTVMNKVQFGVQRHGCGLVDCPTSEGAFVEDAAIVGGQQRRRE